MKKVLVLFMFLVGCAHGKMGRVEQNLAQGSIPAGSTITVEPILADQAAFSGDQAARDEKLKAEKQQIEQNFSRSVADELRKKGYQAQSVTAPVKKGLVLTGRVTRFEHGSAAARILVGMGAGSSNMYTDFELVDRTTNKVLSKFEVIATSGGNGGLQAAGGYINAHIMDGAEKAADYIAKSNGTSK